MPFISRVPASDDAISAEKSWSIWAMCLAASCVRLGPRRAPPAFLPLR
jgi:hypothetical protein